MMVVVADDIATMVNGIVSLEKHDLANEDLVVVEQSRADWNMMDAPSQ